jgi:hypothetical protein
MAIAIMCRDGMKYYLYISDAKVDMLLPQISEDAKRKVATQFGIDMKIFTAKRTVERDEGADRIARLEAVVQHIREYGNVGTVDEPDEYIDDMLPMRFMSTNPKVSSDLIYLSGHTQTTIIGLGGSAIHVIGSRPAGDKCWMSNSNTLILIHSLPHILRDEGVPQDEEEDALWPVVNLEIDGPKTPYENFEFLAKRLVTNRQTVAGKPKVWNVILATPLYIAKAD